LFRFLMQVLQSLFTKEFSVLRKVSTTIENKSGENQPNIFIVLILKYKKNII
jgi:hypothetical protein